MGLVVRAISPGVPPSPNSKPINIPLFELTQEEEPLEFTKEELPDFFKFGDTGLISYERFLVIATLLALPESEVTVAYYMCSGSEFKTEKLRSTGLNVHNFDFIMQRNIVINGRGYSREETLMKYLFGEDLSKTITLDEFSKFHRDLRDQVEKIKFYLLSDRLDPNGDPLMLVHSIKPYSNLFTGRSLLLLKVLQH